MATPSRERMDALLKTQPEPGMSLDTVPIPDPGSGEVRIHVESVGIDGGAEALIYDWHESKRFYESELPQLFGHEFAGTIDSVGSGVEHFEAGDRVAIEPFVGCGHCRYCRSGSPALCEEGRLIGLDPEIDGALAEYAVVPQETLYPIGGLTADEGVFLELLGLAVLGIERSEFKAGDSVAITGPGSVGIGMLVAVRAAGASSITVVGTEEDVESRLPLAEELGATRTVTTEEGIDEEIDVFFETSGHPTALSMATEAMSRNGEIIQIGIYHGHETVPARFNQFVRKSIRITPVYGRRDSSWRRATAIAEGTDLSPAIGPSFPLSEYEAGFEAVREREGIKVTLHP